MKVQEIAYHRNGVSGEPFYVVTFTDDGRDMVAVVFPDDTGSFTKPDTFTNPHTAVFDRQLLGEGTIAFGVNSFRGDHFDSDLRHAITAHEAMPV